MEETGDPSGRKSCSGHLLEEYTGGSEGKQGGQSMSRVRRIRRYQQIASKMLKTRVLLQDPFLREMIPETLWYSRMNLMEMLERHDTVYVKPDKGGGGVGILRIEKRGMDCYRVCFRTRCKVVNRRQLLEAVESLLSSGKRYLLQQGIQLAHYRGSPFDLRILLQKPNRRWIVSGMVAKVAASGRFVTNYSRGGHPLPVEKALATVASLPMERERISRALHHMAERVAAVLNERFPGLRELGIDVGIEPGGRLWIFEVNTRPQFKMFSKIGRRDIFAKIMKYHRIIV
jgi:glutathione synthase/RimK-type ligase-like ATP-grasp enzyme